MAYYYIELANQLERQITAGEYRAGERLPSLRKLRALTGRSISTVYQAYEELENRGLVEVREKSGFFVRPLLGNILPLPKQGMCPVKPHKVAINVLSSLIQRALDNPDLIPFGEAIAAQSLLPGKQIAAAVRAAAAGYQDGSCGVYGASIGDKELRRELAKRSGDIEQQPCGGEIIITHGCMNGIELCLRSVAKSGDMILLESPTFLCYHQLIEDLNMRAIEIPTDPVLGLNLEKLTKTLAEHDVRAALFNPTFQNPLGFEMSATAKEELVTMFADRGIPIIEDDVYGDLYFGESRSRPLKSFDRQGMVLYCSSFSKALLPDLRLGWTIAGKFREKVKRLKFNNSVACSQLMQRALCLYLKSGNYERHLRKLRNSLRKQAADMGQAVARYFPNGTRISSPKGGMNLWVEMSTSVDSLELFHLAEKENIAIMPGTLCSGTGHYNHCIRLCYGAPWDERLEKGMETLGRLVHSLTVVERPSGEQENEEEIVIGLNTDPDFLKIEKIVSSSILKQSGFGIRFQQSMSGNIVKLIASGELHGGFVFGHCEDDRFVVQPLATYYLRIVGPVQMAEKIVDARYEELAELPWIGNPAECPYCQVMNDIFYERGLQPQSVVTVSDESGIVSMLKAGVGLNFMLETEARRFAEEGALVIWEQERFAQALSFVTLKREQEDAGSQLIKRVIDEIW